MDARGTEWEVWEVAVRTLADAPATLLATGRGGESGWLCFESATQRRRLARYPARWQAMLPGELEVLCLEARPEHPRAALGAFGGAAARAW